MAIPRTVPTADSEVPSNSTILRTCLLEAPETLRRPNSRRLSATDLSETVAKESREPLLPQR